jgi:hypothetical protein
MYSLDILTACYGTLNVTDKLINLYKSSKPPPNTYQFTFTPTNGLFGQDPLPNYRKACVVVYRVRFDLLGPLPSQYSQPRVVRAVEGDEAVVSYDGQGLTPFVPGCPANNRFIIDASWWNRDVTDVVSRLSNASPGALQTVKVDSATLGYDPIYGTRKQLMITYANLEPNGTTSYHAAIGADFDTVQVPIGPRPTLRIIAANYGGKDVTVQARNLVKPDQTWVLDTSNANGAFSDPWVGVQKSFVMLYQYGNRPFELLITAERKGVVTLDPYAPAEQSRTQYLHEGNTSKVIGIVWGLMDGQTGPVSQDKYNYINDKGEFPATNNWLGFDGWFGTGKTCVVFAYHNKFGGEIYAVAAREGQTGKLLD